MTKPILFITGSEGFIGKRLAGRSNLMGYPVFLCDTAQAPEQDILDPSIADQIPEGAVIIHLAAISTVNACEADVTRAVRVNVDGTANLARAALKRNCPQFILASTEWVYDGLDGRLTEDRELAYPAKTYPMTKIAAENAAGKLVPGKHTILRFGIVWGQGNPHPTAVESILEDVRLGKASQVGSKDSARRFIYVEDVVSGILASQGHFGTYNLTGNALATLQAIGYAAQCMTDKHPMFLESDPDHPSVRDAPNDKARITFGWEPAYGLQAGMREMMEAVG